MTQDQPQSLVALPDAIDDNVAAAMKSSLDTLWRVAMGRAPAELVADLEDSRRWFDPVAQGQRLRRELARLPEVPPRVIAVEPPLVVMIGSSKALVTPEGRCALDLLRRLPAGHSVHLISDRDLFSYDRLLARLYRDWSRHRLHSVLDLLAGTTNPLQLPAAGVVIALLVNGSTSEQRALTRFAGGRERELVDEAFFEAVDAFVRTLVPRPATRGGDPSLISGWMLYEAGRRLGESIVIEDARAGRDGRVWIRDEDAVISMVGRDLARGHRVRPSVDDLERAFDALVAALRQNLPRLAGFGLVHERPANTQQLRTRLSRSLAANVAGEA
jgi:hypothetical protein